MVRDMLSLTELYLFLFILKFGDINTSNDSNNHNNVHIGHKTLKMIAAK